MQLIRTKYFDVTSRNCGGGSTALFLYTLAFQGLCDIQWPLHRLNDLTSVFTFYKEFSLIKIFLLKNDNSLIIELAYSFLWCTLTVQNLSCYRQDAAKRQTAGIKFTHRPKIRFSPLRTRCTDSGQTWHDRRAPGSAWLSKISPQSAQGVGMRPPKYQKFPLFGKESPRRGEPLNRFLKHLRAFICPTIVHQLFKFHVIRFTGYGVIAEKPRDGQLSLIFPCTL